MKKSLIITIFIGITPIIGFSQEFIYFLKDEHDNLNKLEIATQYNSIKWIMPNGDSKNLVITSFDEDKTESGEYMQIIHVNDRNQGAAFTLMIYPNKSKVAYSMSKKGELLGEYKIVNLKDLKSSGTGFALSSNGYIVTNHHVTKGASSINVRGINGNFSKAYTAKVIIEDNKNDLSIIKIDDPSFTSLGTVPYTIINRPSDVGSSVFVLGYPLRATMGDEVKLTNGIISSKSGFQGDVTSYQITAPIQPGNSGGPLFDDKGNVIGIVNAKHAGAENASYAIKTPYLGNLIDLMPIRPKLQTVNMIFGKPLTDQVKVLKKYTYIIEIN